MEPAQLLWPNVCGGLPRTAAQGRRAAQSTDRRGAARTPGDHRTWDPRGGATVGV
jgi:hypothetical protein